MLTGKRFLLCSGLTATIAARLFAAESSLYRIEPAKILGAENCAECHASMVEAWKLTHHFDTFNTMHRRPEAAEISSKLGVRRIKNESLCIKCHYTFQGAADSAKVISGISCESCHNGGADWNKIHSNKVDPDRLKKAEKLGMLRPSNFYHVAANCFSCHTVPEEKLVNEGGHTPGSDFELAAWSQGEVRHNMQQSSGKKNEESPVARKRMFYVVGRALDLEYGLRGLAKATKEGRYSEAMIKRIDSAKAKLKELHTATQAGEIKELLAIGDGAALKVNQESELLKAADKVSEITAKFAASNDGSKLTGVDAMLPVAGNYKGKVYQP